MKVKQNSIYKNGGIKSIYIYMYIYIYKILLHIYVLDEQNVRVL